jgi:hypothetical protein
MNLEDAIVCIEISSNSFACIEINDQHTQSAPCPTQSYRIRAMIDSQPL